MKDTKFNAVGWKLESGRELAEVEN